MYVCRQTGWVELLAPESSRVQYPYSSSFFEVVPAFSADACPLGGIAWTTTGGHFFAVVYYSGGQSEGHEPKLPRRMRVDRTTCAVRFEAPWEGKW